jgi:hypothetical protein
MIIIEIRDILGSVVKNRMSIGVSFCQVVRIIHIGHEIKVITEGNQKWQGGRPSLVINPNNRNKEDNEGCSNI